MSKPLILQLEEKINEPKRKVLWENPNPSSEMGADTIINLSSSDYDELIWFYIYSNATANLNVQGSTNCQKGNTIMLANIGYSTGASVRRKLEYVNDTRYKATVAKNGETDSAIHLIPVAAVGIKY